MTDLNRERPGVEVINPYDVSDTLLNTKPRVTAFLKDGGTIIGKLTARRQVEGDVEFTIDVGGPIKEYVKLASEIDRFER